MSIEYGFGLYDSGTAEKTTLWDKLYQALSIEDQKFYNDSLCFILMFTDIEKVTEETIPHILNRLKIYHEELYNEYNIPLKLQGMTFEFYLRRFIGYSVNVYTLSSTEYAQKILKRIKRDLKPLTRKEINKIKSPDPSTLLPQEVVLT